jgi:hypothetical protein
MPVAAAVACAANAFTITVVSGDPEHPNVDEEIVYSVPRSYSIRGEQLQWIYAAAADLFSRINADLLIVRKAEGQGSSQERHEVEGVVRLAAHQKGTPSETRIKNQVRAAFKVPPAAGAYNSLLARPDAAARRNADLRHVFLYASAALRAVSS